MSNLTAASSGDISQADLEGQPLMRPGAILENVPGLIVTQHSGEGKANQYFLRAFNLDHGTDLATELDDFYSELIRVRGEDQARLYHDSQVAAVNRIEAICAEILRPCSASQPEAWAPATRCR